MLCVYSKVKCLRVNGPQYNHSKEELIIYYFVRIFNIHKPYDMTCLFFINKVYASTPNVGGSGIDLIIIIACLSLLAGMVYLFKFLLEKYRIARNRTALQNDAGEVVDTIED